MRVAMIGLRGIPSRDGGVEVAVGELAPRLIDSDIQIIVYCRNPYISEKRKHFKGVELVNLPTLNNKNLEAIVHTTLSTIHAIFVAKVDVIHFHALGNALLSRVPQLFGKKSVVTIHGLDYEREKWSCIAKLVLRLGEATAIKYANEVISVSKKIQSYVLAKYGRDINFIPNGIPAMQEGNATKSTPYILFLSRLVPEKGIHTLIDAFSQIDFKGDLLIVGGGTHTDDYVEVIKDSASHDHRIKFLGPKYDQDKSDLLKNAEIFVLPSTIEGMPIVLLEAMSFATPCLVSDIQENIDVVKANEYEIAHIFKAGSAEALAQALRKMIANPQYFKSMGLRAKEEVFKLYNWDSIAEETRKVYASL